jgi:hypothetical protein
MIAIYAHEKIVNGVDKGVIMLSMEARHGSPAINVTTGCTVAATECAFESSSDHGKAMYALLLSAAAQGKPVLSREMAIAGIGLIGSVRSSFGLHIRINGSAI